MRRSIVALSLAFGVGACSSQSGAPIVTIPKAPVSTLSTQTVGDLRFGSAPVPAVAPGFDPSGDAKALFLPGTLSPATAPVPGTIITGSLGPNERFVVRVPTPWNGKLMVAGTPAFRSEYASDFVWGELALARGYAYASSNKGISYNSIVSTASAATVPSTVYPVPFNLLNLETAGIVVQFGVLTQGPSTIKNWNDDFANLTVAAKSVLLQTYGKVPTRTYAVGISNGGAEVRSLLELHPNLVDGGVDWEGPYWSPGKSILTYMPGFLAAMPSYISSGYTDQNAITAIRNLGYPPDVLDPASAAHKSLWQDYYNGTSSFYTDLTLFAYALWLDPTTSSSIGLPVPCTPNAGDPVYQPGTCTGTGLALPANRAAYVPSAAALSTISTFAHTGNIGKPLVSIAGSDDMFITPQNNAYPYQAAVVASGKGALHHLYIVNGGTHLDTFTVFGYTGLQPNLPFAWRAFDELVDIVEHSASVPGAGTAVTVNQPADIPVP
jgi:hypothetical protein